MRIEQQISWGKIEIAYLKEFSRYTFTDMEIFYYVELKKRLHSNA